MKKKNNQTNSQYKFLKFTGYVKESNKLLKAN